MSSVKGLPEDVSILSYSSQESLASVAFSLNRTASFTPYLCLAWIDTLFLGIGVVTFAVWWIRARPTDRKIIQWMICWMMLAAIAFTATYQGYILYMFADRFGLYRQFLEGEWIKIVTLLGGFIRVPAMLFYLHRAYSLLGKKIWIVILVMPMILFVAAAPVLGFIMLKMLPYTIKYKQVLATSAICEMVGDIVITTVIGYRMIKKLLLFVISLLAVVDLAPIVEMLTNSTLAETQAPPTLMSLINFLFFYTLENTTIQVIVIFSPKVAFLCILFTLLSRVYIAESHKKDGAQYPSYSNGTNNTALSSQGAVFYGQDKGHVVHHDMSGTDKGLNSGTSGETMGTLELQDLAYRSDTRLV